MKWKHSGRELWLLEWSECKIHFLICLDSHFRPDWRRHKCFLDIVMVTLVILEISSVNTLISSFFPKRIFKVSHVAYWRRISEEFIHVIRDPRMVFYWPSASDSIWSDCTDFGLDWSDLKQMFDFRAIISRLIWLNVLELLPSGRKKISRIGKWQKISCCENRAKSFNILHHSEQNRILSSLSNRHRRNIHNFDKSVNCSFCILRVVQTKAI